MSQKNPRIAYCKVKKKYLTRNQIRLHHCLDLPRTRSPCKGLVKLDVDYWEKRKQRKIKRKSYKEWLQNGGNIKCRLKE